MASLAVSNIAWANEEELDVACKLQELGVKEVEIAPTKRWDDPTAASDTEVKEYRDWWHQFGIDVVAFQSMLFARPDLKLFESSKLRYEMTEYMRGFVHLAGQFGAKRLVFGSPKNRQRGNLSKGEADLIAEQFFEELGKASLDNNTILCLEPNAPQYNCDYVTTAAEGAELVNRVESAGFALHLDTACMALASDDISRAIMDNAGILKHFHVSAPMLDRVYDRTDVNYHAAAAALKSINYDGTISIEMRPGEVGDNVRRVEDAVKFVQSTFPID